jgi:PleD family two-component response regulator
MNEAEPACPQLLLTNCCTRFKIGKFFSKNSMVKDKFYFCSVQAPIEIYQPETMNTVDNLPIETVILADDDQDDKDFFDSAMKEINPSIKIFNVPNGKELMRLLDSFVPDMVFLDLDMPVMNGLECLVAIAKKPELEKMPVVVYSSTTRQANIQTAYEMGAHLYFIKPVVYQHYLNSLKSILKLDWSNPVAVREQYCVNNRYTAFA